MKYGFYLNEEEKLKEIPSPTSYLSFVPIHVTGKPSNGSQQTESAFTKKQTIHLVNLNKNHTFQTLKQNKEKQVSKFKLYLELKLKYMNYININIETIAIILKPLPQLPQCVTKVVQTEPHIIS